MQFQSLPFVFGFLPLVLCGYLILRKTRFANAFMLLASLFFYAFGALWYLVPFFFTALIDFFIGQRIQDSEDARYRRFLLIVSICANLVVLSFFKYTSWLTTGLSTSLTKLGVAFSPVLVALPPAISFYTFQSMSYTIDIYRRDFKPYRNVIDYLSFVAFFPHLVAGPIMRARDLLPQLARLRPIPNWQTVSTALFMILYGLFQKTALADNFGGIVQFIQRMMGGSGNPLPPGIGLLFAYAFAFQIYCDFAAYSTIARGVARLFGVDLMRNFLTPYVSSNPSEFWTRWHISLSTWLRDYLYVPLGGNRHGTAMTLRNLVITMFLGGLWHGAGMLFIVWGLYHGLLLVLYRLFPIDEWLIKRLGRLGKVLAVFLFFQLLCVGWIFFRASTIELGSIWNSILHSGDIVVSGLTALSSTWSLVANGKASIGSLVKTPMLAILHAHWVFAVLTWGLVLFSVPVIAADLVAYRRGVEFPDLFDRMPAALKVVIIVAILYGIIFFAKREANEFIYFAF
jgi:alginate O-acetyltransferase complex protein AlgI